ncbi:MAG: lectin like domain-containing protein, partial [Thermoplasmatota archaeon]
EVHYGGDYRVASAYLTRHGGVYSPAANDDTEKDDPWFYPAPDRYNNGYERYYPREIAWYTAGENLERIDTIKQAVMDHGVVGTCMCFSGSFIDDYIHYQPPDDDTPPNHAVAIIGWDDGMETQAPEPGAWLVKNSWGSGWGNDGYFWISYYDKWCGQHPEMGAVSYQQVELMQYDHLYCHDYHGWRDTMKRASDAFNAFTATNDTLLEAVGFYTAADAISYTVTVYDRFADGALQDELATASGTLEHTGYHTVDVGPVAFTANDDFYLQLSLSDGGQPFDRTSEVPVLLGCQRQGTTVTSSASRGESYVHVGQRWLDVTYIRPTANFCIKGFANPWTPTTPDLACSGSLSWSDVRPGRQVTGSFTVENIGEEHSSLDWEITEWPEWGDWTFTPTSRDNIKPGCPASVEVTVDIPDQEDSSFSGTLTVVNTENSSDTATIPISVSTPKTSTLPPLLKLFIQRFPVLQQLLYHLL